MPSKFVVFYWRFIYSYKNFIRVFMIVLALLIERAKLMFDCTMHASFFSPSFFLRPVCIFSGSFPFILIANRWEISDDQCIYIDELAIIKKNWNLAYLFKFFIYIYRGDNFLVFIVSIPIGDITYSKRWFHQLKLIM